MDLIELTDDEFAKFRVLIYKVAGIQIAENKRILISNRVRRRLRGTGIASYSAYYTFLTSPSGAGEMQHFIDAVTTNETYFFRDQQHYDWLGDEFLPDLIQETAKHRRKRSLRIWSAACSTGEEPYSIAVKLATHRPALANWRLNVLGTDLSSLALAAARAAVYDERAVHLVGPDDRKRYFDEDAAAKRWSPRPEVRSVVTFLPHNLLYPLKEEPFDCIFLKNVLIYFDLESKQRVVDNVLAALAPGGRLVIGPTEGIHGMLGSLQKIKTWLYQKNG